MISIIVVTHNSFRCLDRLLRSLRAFPPVTGGVDPRAAYELIIVDNGSTRPETRALLTELEVANEAVVIRHPENRWFTAGCNAGIDKAGGDTILLLNPDCQALKAGWLGEMAAIADRPRVGIVGAVLVNELGMIVHAGARGMGQHIGLGQTYNSTLPFVKERKLFAPDTWVTGACLLVTRAALEAVGGGLDTKYPHHHSDRVLGEMVRRAGYEIWLSSAVLVHSVGGSGQ